MDIDTDALMLGVTVALGAAVFLLAVVCAIRLSIAPFTRATFVVVAVYAAALVGMTILPFACD